MPLSFVAFLLSPFAFFACFYAEDWQLGGNGKGRCVLRCHKINLQGLYVTLDRPCIPPSLNGFEMIRDDNGHCLMNWSSVQRLLRSQPHRQRPEKASAHLAFSGQVFLNIIRKLEAGRYGRERERKKEMYAVVDTRITLFQPEMSSHQSSQQRINGYHVAMTCAFSCACVRPICLCSLVPMLHLKTIVPQS